MTYTFSKQEKKKFSDFRRGFDVTQKAQKKVNGGPVANETLALNGLSVMSHSNEICSS